MRGLNRMSARMLNEEDVKKSVKKAIMEEHLVSEERLRQIIREELQNKEKEEQEQDKKGLWDYFIVFVNEDKLPIYVLLSLIIIMCDFAIVLCASIAIRLMSKITLVAGVSYLINTFLIIVFAILFGIALSYLVDRPFKYMNKKYPKIAKIILFGFLVYFSYAMFPELKDILDVIL